MKNEVHERLAEYASNGEHEEAILEAARRIVDRRLLRLGAVPRPELAFPLIRDRLAGETRETMFVVYLDSRCHIITVEQLAIGTLQMCAVYPRELIHAALRFNAAAVILAHNHPSGSNEPSVEDRLLTDRLRQALTFVEIRLLDHLIVGDDVISMAQLGML